MTVVHVFVKNENFKIVPKGVGVLYPSDEGTSIMGILFNSSAFSHHHKDLHTASFTVMINSLELSEEEIKNQIYHLHKLFTLNSFNFDYYIHKIPNALPIYDENLEIFINTSQKYLSNQVGTVLFGNYTGQISIRGMIESTLKL
jgi:protoporphyrinogen oxidase